MENFAQTRTYPPDNYPFSSVIDWEKEEEKLEKRKQQQLASQRNMAKTQLLGDTFKLLGETVGAFAGADVSKREPSPFLTNALEQRQKAEDDYLTAADKLKQQRYSMLLRDKERQLQLADQEAKERKDRDVKAEERAYQKTVKEDDRQFQKEQAEAAHTRAVALQQLKYKEEQAKQAAKQEADKKANTLTISSYDDPLNTKVEIDKTEAINLLSDFRDWFAEKYPYETLPSTANIDKSGLIRDEDLIKTIRNFPEFFLQYYPQLLTKGFPEPEKPEERRFKTFDNNVNAAIERYKIDPSWGENKKARVQKRLENELNRLNSEYSDVIGYRDWQEKQRDWEAATGQAPTPTSQPTIEDIARETYNPETGQTDLSVLGLW